MPRHQVSPRDKLRNRMLRLIKQDPELAAELLLQHPFWPPSLKGADAGQVRYSDDQRLGIIQVMFSHDSDAWIHILSIPDPDEMSVTHRFRTYFGGGESPCTWQALLILALAMRLDNMHRPQNRGPA